jgi:hypothetical protein
MDVAGMVLLADVVRHMGLVMQERKVRLQMKHAAYVAEVLLGNNA